ncbi:MAG: hypothetical protein ABJP08_29065 [Roseibium sp.]
MKNEDMIFENGPLAVSASMLRFRGRRYKLAHIENLILKRPLFWIAAGFSFSIGFFALVNDDLLYWYETLLFLLIAAGIPVLAWPIGTLVMHSRTLSTNEGSITWIYRDLAKAQDAIESVTDTDRELL